MSKTILIDANSIGHAAHHATKLTSGALQTQAIFGFIKSVRDMRQEYPDHTLMALWDDRAQWRFDMHPKYKSNRDNDPKKTKDREAYSAQRPFIHRALQHLGVRQLTAKAYEADDLAGYLVNQLTAKPGNEVVLMSGDGDWIQLVRPGVTWRDRRDDSKVVTLKNIMDKTGYPTPYAFLEGKCLQGDTSDVISGVGGIGEDTAPLFMAEFGSVREFWRQCDSGELVPTKKAHLNLWKGASPFTKEEWAEKFEGDKLDKKALKKHMDGWIGQGRAIFGRNLRLMQLLKVAPPTKETVNLNLGRFDEEAFRELCEELAFGSILRNFDSFTRYFKP